jgi:dolichol kinase
MVNKKKKVMLELRRQIFHAFGALLVPLMYLIGYENMKLFMALALVVITMSSFYRQTKTGKRTFILQKFYKIESWFEKQLFKYERGDEFLLGSIYYVLGIYACTMLFPIEMAAAAILVLTISDSASTLIGYTYGTHRLPYNKNKSWEGSITFAITAIGIMYFFVPQQAILIGVLLALTESLPRLNDNISIPLATGILMTLL